MRVLVLGGTGSIGASVVRAMVSRRHEVLALARSDASADSLSVQGAQPLRGDIRRPEAWADIAKSVDAVVQVAGDFTADADSVGRNLISALLPRLDAATGRPRPLTARGRRRAIPLCHQLGRDGRMLYHQAKDVFPSYVLTVRSRSS